MSVRSANGGYPGGSRWFRVQLWKNVVHGVEVWNGYRGELFTFDIAESVIIGGLEHLANIYWRNTSGHVTDTTNPFLNPLDNSLSGFGFVRAPRLIRNRIEVIPQKAPQGTTFNTDVIQYQLQDAGGNWGIPVNWTDLQDLGGQVVTMARPPGYQTGYRIRRYVRFGSTGFNYTKWYTIADGSDTFSVDPFNNDGGAEPIFGDVSSLSVFDEVNGQNLPEITFGRAV